MTEMTEPVRKLYKESLDNEEFVQSLKEAEGKEYIRPIFRGNNTKVFVACIYMGWKMARGEYNESDYK